MASELILTHMSGPEDGRVVRLLAKGKPPEVTLGRSVECDVCLAHDPDVSRTHCRLFWRSQAWWVEDLGSTNGTHVGEFAQSVKITGPTQRLPGQVFRVGCTRFRLEAAGELGASGLK